MRMVLLLAVLTVGCERVPVARPDGDKDAKGNNDPPVKANPPSTPPRPKPHPGPTQPTPKTRAESFEEAWSAALVMADETDALEPELTEKALAALTRSERATAASLMNPRLLHANARALARLGVGAWTARESRKVARDDPAFVATVRAIWNPEDGPRGILAAMNVWGAVPVRDRTLARNVAVAGARTADLDPATRDVIILLGGRAWLEGR